MKEDSPRALLSFPINYTHFTEVKRTGKKKCSWNFFLTQILRPFSNSQDEVQLSGELISEDEQFTQFRLLKIFFQWGGFFPLNYLNNCFNSSVQFACLDRKLDWIRFGRTVIFETAFFFWNCILNCNYYYLPCITSLTACIWGLPEILWHFKHSSSNI